MKSIAVILLAAGLPMLGLAQDINIEAESGVIHAPFVSTNGFIYQPDATDAAKGGLAEYEFNVAQAGSYLVRGVVSTAAPATNAFLVNIEVDRNSEEFTWTIQATSGFEARNVTSPLGRQMVLGLSAGKHRLFVRGLAANVKVDRWEVAKVNRPAPPGGLRLVVSPQ